MIIKYSYFNLYLVVLVIYAEWVISDYLIALLFLFSIEKNVN